MKTNHRRRFKDKGPKTVFSRYITFYEQAVALDGTVIEACATSGDHCRGKRGMRRDRAGAKKFIHSRLRRRNRDYLKKVLAGDVDC